MHSSYSTEFIYQLFARIITVIVVRASYGTRVRPQAEAFLDQGEHVSSARVYRSTYGILLNGNRIGTRAELHAGDLLDLGGPGQHLQLITVAEPNAPP